MNFITDSLHADWEAFLAFSPRLIYAAVLLLVFVVAGRFAGRAASRLLQRSAALRSSERLIRLTLTWSIVAIGMLSALGVMGFTGVAASLLATGGVLAIVLGFAFREIGENLLAGIFLTFSRPLDVGDLIKTGNLTGTVRAINIRSVHIRTGDACDVFVPSAQIFREPLHNYTRDGLRRPSFSVGVAYHDQPEVVIDLLERTVATVDDVLETPAAFATIAEFSDNWITYEVFFYLDVGRSPRGLVAVSNDVKSACWRALHDAGMTFSSDTTTSIDITAVPAIEVRDGTR